MTPSGVSFTPSCMRIDQTLYGRANTMNRVTSNVYVSTLKDGTDAKQHTSFYHVQAHVPSISLLLCKVRINLTLCLISPLENNLQMKALSCPKPSDFWKSVAFSKVPKTSSACPGKSNVLMKMSMERGWKDSDGGKPKYSRTPLIRINLGGEQSTYAENLDTWIFI